MANADLETLTANANNWGMQAGGLYNQRHSKPSQINRGNVGKRQATWTCSTGVLRGLQGSPLVFDGRMHPHPPFPHTVFAIDLQTQNILCKSEPRQDPAAIPQRGGGTLNSGLACS